mgnify:CR=1 FL=1
MVEFGKKKDGKAWHLSIIFPWSLNLLKFAHYIEFDASFFGMRSYAYCLAQGIFYNESIPLSISIAPQESNELFEMIIDNFNELSENQIN